MSGNASQWAVRERIRLAELDQYGYGEARYDSVAQRFRTVRAIEDPNYSITDKTLPDDGPVARILRTLEECLISDDHASLQRAADELERIILSYPANKWFNYYLKVVEMILSAAKGVDGQTATDMLVQLVSALSSRDNLVNTTRTDLAYDIGDDGPVVVRPGATLTDQDGLKVWSQMPSLQLWIAESVENYPGSDQRFKSDVQWPGNSWQNFTRFCSALSCMHVAQKSAVSSLLPETCLRCLLLGVELPETNMRWKTLAAVYMSLFSHEIRTLCEHKVHASFGQNDSTADEETYSLERWSVWLDAFRSRAASTDDERHWAAKALESMEEVGRVTGA